MLPRCMPEIRSRCVEYGTSADSAAVLEVHIGQPGFKAGLQLGRQGRVDARERAMMDESVPLRKSKHARHDTSAPEEYPDRRPKCAIVDTAQMTGRLSAKMGFAAAGRYGRVADDSN